MDKNVAKLYKLYNIKDKREYTGSTEKCECTINGEQGIFKEKISMQSVDNVMEDVAYRLAYVLGVPCAFASCRKHDNILGSFSRYEIPNNFELEHLSVVLNADELYVDRLLESIAAISKRYNNNWIHRIYQYIIFDYILGQRDRHLENLALIYKGRYTEKGSYIYQLYDNGICCFSTESSENAIRFLDNGFYSSRIGMSEEILTAIKIFKLKYRVADLRSYVNYTVVSREMLSNIIDKADKYRQITKGRKEATINFIMRNIYDIDKVNRG